MSGTWRKTMAYLGLVEMEPEPYEYAANQSSTVTPTIAPPSIDLTDEEPAVTVVAPPAPDPHGATVRPLRVVDAATRIGGRVRGATTVNVRVVEIAVFDQAADVGALLRDGTPVLVDLRGTDTGIARKCIDFLAGAVVVSGAKMSGAGQRSYLVTPVGVEIRDEEITRLRGLGFQID